MKKLLELYIYKTESELHETIEHELNLPKTTEVHENRIHLLFENRKHAKEWLCELDGGAHHAATPSTTR